MAIDTPLFAQHSRRWQDNRYVYPVISRRSRGLSIGVNLNPDGVCNFDCAYCCVDRSAPTRVRSALKDVDLTVLRLELDHALTIALNGTLFAQPPFDTTPQPLRRLNDVAFSGDGEPTTFPRFAEVCALAVELLTWHNTAAKVVTITNATMLHQERVQVALDSLGERCEVWAKLDAGSEPYYRLVDRSDVPFERILNNLLIAGKRRPLVIQTLFARLHGEVPPAAEIAAWLARLTDLRAGGATIERVQVYTTARSTTESWVEPLTRSEVDGIVAQAQATGLDAEAFYAPG